MAVPYELIIRETHIDTFGHVNNATYLQLFEEARWELITQKGYGLAEIMKSRKGPVILDVHLTFQKEIRLREKIRITTEMLSYTGKVGKMKQAMIKDDGAIAAEAVFTFGLFDLKERRLIEPTPEWKQALDLGTA